MYAGGEAVDDVDDTLIEDLVEAVVARILSRTDIPIQINASGHISRVTLADTITTYTGNTPQTGDSFARIGVNGAGLTAVSGGTPVPLAEGTVAGTPTTTVVQLTDSNLVAVSGAYNGRTLYFTDGTIETYQTAPCVSHVAVGTGTSAVHTFTFSAVQKLATAGDKAGII
jgi:hypothetical protein